VSFKCLKAGGACENAWRYAHLLLLPLLLFFLLFLLQKQTKRQAVALTEEASTEPTQVYSRC
jgi:hypothetical protein